MEVIIVLSLIGQLVMSLLIVPDLARRQGRKVGTWVILVLLFSHWAYLLLYFLPKRNPTNEFHQSDLMEAVESVQEGADRVVSRFKEAAQGPTPARSGGSEFTRADSVKSEMEMRDEVVPLIEHLIETRADLMSAGEDELADKVRDRLVRMGVVLKDNPEGTTWHRLKE